MKYLTPLFPLDPKELIGNSVFTLLSALNFQTHKIVIFKFWSGDRNYSAFKFYMIIFHSASWDGDNCKNKKCTVLKDLDQNAHLL